MKVFNRTSVFLLAGILILFAGMVSSSCATVYKEKLYTDVIYFNDDAVFKEGSLPTDKTDKDGNTVFTPHPFVLKGDNMPDQSDTFADTINALPAGENTAAYYAFDLALDRVAKVQKKYMENDPATKYYIVFFTDGLDNVSREMAKRNRRGNYEIDSEYAAALQSRMEHLLKKYTFFGLIPSSKPNLTNSFQSYVMLYAGDDIKKSNYSPEELETILSPFTGAQNEQRPKVLLGDDFDKLLTDFKNSFVVSSFSFVLPKGYAGSTIRMELNDTENETDKVFFECEVKKGTKPYLFIFKKDYYTLENIKTSSGLSIEMPSNGIIGMDEISYNKDSNSVPFKINGLRLNGGPYMVDRDLVTQWVYNMGKPRLNSEYRKDAGSKKDAYILLVMDTSKSFGEMLPLAKKTATDIVFYIRDQM